MWTGNHMTFLRLGNYVVPARMQLTVETGIVLVCQVKIVLTVIVGGTNTTEHISARAWCITDTFLLLTGHATSAQSGGAPHCVHITPRPKQ
jgi:hypothetical protein